MICRALLVCTFPDQIYFDGVGYGVRIGDLGADDQKIIDLVFNSVKRDATAK